MVSDQLVRDIVSFLQLHYTSFPISAITYKFKINESEAIEALNIINELKD